MLLSVGGWSYNDTPLEGVFLAATSTGAGTEKLARSILDMCEAYGFDGVDMDWEHPRVDGTSAKQYEDLMLALAGPLHAEGKLLTAQLQQRGVYAGDGWNWVRGMVQRIRVRKNGRSSRELIVSRGWPQKRLAAPHSTTSQAACGGQTRRNTSLPCFC